MSRIRMKTIRELNEKDLGQKLQESRTELVKLKTQGSKGTLRKESGKIRAVKKDIARMMTRQSEMRNK